MRPSQPRIAPLPAADWNDEQRKLLEPFVKSGTAWNVFKTLVRHVGLFKRWLPFATHVLAKQSLALREREILILRIGWLCRSPYEWAQHVQIAQRAGLTMEEIERIADGPDATGWAAHEANLLRAADELHRDACIHEATWRALATTYDERQLMDIVFTVGQYTLVAMALNSFGVQIDAELPRVARSPE